MAKDRFKNRYSYDNDFRYGRTEVSVKSSRSITSEQVDFLKQLYSIPTLNNWEKVFLKTVLKQNSISEKQKEVIKRINRLKNK